MLARLFLIGAVVGAIIVGGRTLLGAAGVDSSPEAMRSWIEGYGLWGPAAYVGLLSARHFLFLPSTVMLTLGGAVLGAIPGAIAGTIGLFLSAVIEFWIFRNLKPRRLVAKLEAQAGSRVDSVERGTPLAIFVSTAVPPMPMTFVYWAASLTKIAIPVFALLAFMGGLVRAIALSVLGAGLVAANLTMIFLAAGSCAVMIGVVALSPTLRAMMLPPAPGSLTDRPSG